MIHVNLGVGIGAGILIDGHIFEGTHGYAGEIGHMVMTDGQGPRCSCGRYGCLEAMCSTRAVVSRLNEALQGHPDERVRNLAPLTDVAAIHEMALDELPEVSRILCDAGRTIGIAVANLVNLFNPELIVVGGELAAASDLVVSALRESVNEHALPQLTRDLAIIRSQMTQDPSLIGAYAIVLGRVKAMEEWKRGQPTQPSLLSDRRGENLPHT